MSTTYRRTHLGMRAPGRTVSANAVSSVRAVTAGRSASATSVPDHRRAETSMRVLVRVRGTAPAGESVLVTEGARGEHVTLVQDASPSSSRSRTYAFDRVLSAEADQNMVYTEAIGSVLDDVLLGYHCTIFAYGQTGTGKTHTMEGDLSSFMETYAPDAGVIPRALYRLFHVLESRGNDYAVRMSLVELYNEELRDLLCDEPTSLRMYDDPRGRGVMLQGVEEVPLTSAAHGLALLRRGSERRHVASTLCNHTSSRSHCVFTLTVHVKDTSGARSQGEEMMRIGKMNLVDLAGSESIGRSGAEHRRAREAGAINQSLLTLGRVINALVEGSAHVPYRESRLTRLLQDSLGGRAKTCIIATVSDDRENLDETLSTLDYASRAKSIKNRPEASQRMSRAALLREYVTEMDRLRSDLAATRAQNGIYVSEENWARMEAERALLKKQLDEHQRGADVSASRLHSIQEQLEQNSRVLAKREADAARAESELQTLTQQAERDLASLMERVHSHATRIQQSIESSLASMRSVGDAPAFTQHVVQILQEHLDALHTEHTQSAAAFGTSLQTHARHVAALLETSQSLGRAWHTSLAETESHTEALLQQAQSNSAHAHEHAAHAAQRWTEAQRAVQTDADTLKAALLEAIDTFVHTQDTRMAHHAYEATHAERDAAHAHTSTVPLLEAQKQAMQKARHEHQTALMQMEQAVQHVYDSEPSHQGAWSTYQRHVRDAEQIARESIGLTTQQVAAPTEHYIQASRASTLAAVETVKEVHTALGTLTDRWPLQDCDTNRSVPSITPLKRRV